MQFFDGAKNLGFHSLRFAWIANDNDPSPLKLANVFWRPRMNDSQPKNKTNKNRNEGNHPNGRAQNFAKPISKIVQFYPLHKTHTSILNCQKNTYYSNFSKG
ncbi:hypothetical protein J2W36_002439 [Variovorax ginsengisoli]|uniref:Uncharacterized protein n=1 Tax=Variovorax ginsengisoli TaxID=363844 RepID=A0ABT9S752_9BURK|nr:hypothetical protein [Variovorax ginsengisoli]